MSPAGPDWCPHGMASQNTGQTSAVRVAAFRAIARISDKALAHELRGFALALSAANHFIEGRIQYRREPEAGQIADKKLQTDRAPQNSRLSCRVKHLAFEFNRRDSHPSLALRMTEPVSLCEP